MIPAVAIKIVAIVLICVVARTLHWQWFTKRLKVTYENAPAWTFIYFSAFALLIWVLFRAEIVQLFSGVTFVGYLALAFLFVVVFPLVYHWLRVGTGIPKWLVSLTPDEPILTLGERFILAKVADVVMQEFAAGAIIIILATSGVSYPMIVLACLVIFGAAHAYIFLTSGFFWGLYYTSFAMLAGFAIPFLILFVPGGIAYALVLHMLFYVLSAAFFAMLPRPSRAITHDILGPAHAVK